MAAELTGRICYGIDIDPRYVDVAVLRWQEFTGQEATLEADGRSFDQVRAERVGVAA
jgi:DNA modification methylase